MRRRRRLRPAAVLVVSPEVVSFFALRCSSRVRQNSQAPLPEDFPEPGSQVPRHLSVWKRPQLGPGPSLSLTIKWASCLSFFLFQRNHALVEDWSSKESVSGGKADCWVSGTGEFLWTPEGMSSPPCTRSAGRRLTRSLTGLWSIPSRLR